MQKVTVTYRDLSGSRQTIDVNKIPAASVKAALRCTLDVLKERVDPIIVTVDDLYSNMRSITTFHFDLGVRETVQERIQ